MTRRYIILNSNDRSFVDWLEVCEVSIEAVRWSNNGEKILLSYIGHKPAFLNDCGGYRLVTKKFLRELTSTSTGWSNIEEEIN
tara:strand:+ start:85 stop:333 length:249 start_codon:yes stop_codon:yes gene_type:complete